MKCEIFDPMYVETQKLAPCYTEAKGWPVQYQGPGVTICLVENGWECSCDKLLKITLAARQAVKAAAAVAWAAVAVAVVAATTPTTTTTKQVSWHLGLPGWLSVSTCTHHNYGLLVVWGLWLRTPSWTKGDTSTAQQWGRPCRAALCQLCFKACMKAEKWNCLPLPFLLGPGPFKSSLLAWHSSEWASGGH